MASANTTVDDLLMLVNSLYHSMWAWAWGCGGALDKLVLLHSIVTRPFKLVIVK
jgi:hypothetical protein